MKHDISFPSSCCFSLASFAAASSARAFAFLSKLKWEGGEGGVLLLLVREGMRGASEEESMITQTKHTTRNNNTQIIKH